MSEEKITAGNAGQMPQKAAAPADSPARRRIAELFDPGSFVELDASVVHRCRDFGMDSKRAPGDGVICGYGTCDSRLVFAFAQDTGFMGGSLGEAHAGKIVKVQEMALRAGAPVVGLLDSGGARIQEGVDALSGYGKMFRNNTLSSGVIPQISVILGSCAGGAVYSPAITDFIFTVDKQSRMFITGPDVIKAVTGEVVSAEQLGGASTHNTVSGVAHFMAENETEALQQVRTLLSYLPSNNMELPPSGECADPDRQCTELDEIIPENPNKAYDMYSVIGSLTEDFLEVQPMYAKNMITCLARIGGRTAGIIANQPKAGAGCIDIDASDKAARFIRFCDAFNIPLVTLADVPGFLPGTGQEYGGIIRHGAKMLYAYSEATVPKITVILRKAYGGAYIAMCCKELGADIVMAWPSAQIAVMGAEGAANIIFRNKTADRRKKIMEYEERFNNPYRAAERGYVEAVIRPAETKQRIISGLDMLEAKRETIPAKKHGNIPL